MFGMDLDAGRAHDVMYITTHQPALMRTQHQQLPARAPAPPPISTAAPNIIIQRISVSPPIRTTCKKLESTLCFLLQNLPPRDYHTPTLTAVRLSPLQNNSRRDSRDHRSSFGGQVFRLWLSHALSSPSRCQPSAYSSPLRNTTSPSLTPHAVDRQRNHTSNQAGRTVGTGHRYTARPTYQAHMHHCIPSIEHSSSTIL